MEKALAGMQREAAVGGGYGILAHGIIPAEPAAPGVGRGATGSSPGPPSLSRARGPVSQAFVKNLWNERDAAGFPGELGQRVYASRLLGSDPSLVLHGGGNTSVKTAGTGGELLYVKTSGADLADVNEGNFAALRLVPVRELLEDPGLDNREMMRRLDHCLVDPASSRPSIETLLHGALPFPCVDHSHADAILALVNTRNGESIARTVFGELAPLVPYRHSGVELARACLGTFRARGTARTLGLILQFHGVVSFGASARESYENMVRLVTLAEDYLQARNAWELSRTPDLPPVADPMALAKLRREVSRIAGKPLIARVLRDPVSVAFARRSDLPEISQQGPGTPQHAVFCRRVPMLDHDAAAFAARYREYLQRHLGSAWQGIIDPAPRTLLDPDLGLAAFGVSPRFADMSAELYRHDIEIISRASAHDRYASAPALQMAKAELEYAGFETMARHDSSKPLLGQVMALTPGAASTDAALAQRLLARGAAVVAPRPAPGSAASVAVHSYGEADPAAAAAGAILAFGGVDVLFAQDTETTWRRAFEPLLEHSTVARRVEAVA